MRGCWLDFLVAEVQVFRFRHMSQAQPSYDDYLRIFRQEIDEHLNWQEAREYYDVLTLESGWRRPARTVFEEMEKLRVTGKIPSSRFEKSLSDFYWTYSS
jgi:hypothetical protein